MIKPMESRLRWAVIGILGFVLLPLQRPFAAGEADGLTLLAEGTLYEAGSKRQNVWYHWKLFTTEDGSRRSTEYVTPEGELAASEQVVLENGKLERYTVLEHNAGRKALVRRVEDKIEFSYTKDGNTDTRSEDYGDGLVVGQTLIPYIQSHWSRIMQGKDLEVRFGVFRLSLVTYCGSRTCSLMRLYPSSSKDSRLTFASGFRRSMSSASCNRA